MNSFLTFVFIFLITNLQCTTQSPKTAAPLESGAAASNSTDSPAVPKEGYHHPTQSPSGGTSSPESGAPPAFSSTFISNMTQLVTHGKRSGEGYFSPYGRYMIYQSQGLEENPFYQIYLFDRKTQQTTQISPGKGKTTCGWIHPSRKKLLFSSTHHDPKAQEKLEMELAERAKSSGRYSWSFDDQYEIYQSDFPVDKPPSAKPPNEQRTQTPHPPDKNVKKLKRLTRTLGYDAEASYSPDGKWILFSSNRHAYSEKLTPEQQVQLKEDPGFFTELYIMREDGTQVKRLTFQDGNDGGPFFSPNGKQIVWRHFSDKQVAEIWIMNSDGTNPQALTQLGQTSWAPFFHPSGKYIIFATSLHGHHNFELYLVDTLGAHAPVRVTDSPGFDGLPVFLPNGWQIAFSHSTGKMPGEAQIFLADWNHGEALKALGLLDPLPLDPNQNPNQNPSEVLSPQPPSAKEPGDQTLGFPNLKDLEKKVSEKNLEKFARYLTSEPLGGRRTGTPGETLYTEAIANYFKSLKLEPMGDQKSYLQKFEFTAGVSLGEKNTFELAEHSPLTLMQDWVPVGFSASGAFVASSVVFAGYGIVAEGTDKVKAYDSYAGLDVKDKWVLVFRFAPSEVSDEERLHLNHYATLRNKAFAARSRGAKGIIFVSGPESKVKNELVALQMDGSPVGDAMAAISVSDAAAQKILDRLDNKLDSKLDKGKKQLSSLQQILNKGERLAGFEIPMKIEAQLSLIPIKKVGFNVVGKIKATSGSDSLLMVGAHGDHLGTGDVESSLARAEEKGRIHPGADDNASGVSVLLELARYFAFQRPLKHNLVFAVWAGEEVGMLGSTHFLKTTPSKTKIKAYLNMDMVGRLRKQLVLQGVGSSRAWPKMIAAALGQQDLLTVEQQDPFLPTDSTAFYLKEIPTLNLFTGAHAEYHSPRDQFPTLNIEGMKQVTEFMISLVAKVANQAPAIPYEKIQNVEKNDMGKRRMRIFLGTMPDYSDESTEGLKISGVVKGGPADQAGLKGGDIIVNFGGKKIKNIYDYTFALDAARIGESTSITVLRADKRINLNIVPLSRE